MTRRPDARPPRRILVLGGGSEIALAILAALSLPPDAEVLLAGRNEQALLAAAKELPCGAATVPFDATALDTHQALVDGVFADGAVDLVISAAGVLIGQDRLDREPLTAGQLIEANFTGHVTTLLAVAARMRQQGHGTIVVLSSIAAIRPRKANYVYGAAKAGLDAFARGLADSLHGTGVRVLLARPGFVTGRMTAGLPPAPLASTPADVGATVAAALRQDASLVWVPRQLRVLGAALLLIPRPLWRRLRR